MDDNTNKMPLLPASAILALITAFGVFMFTQLPLKSPRPSGPPSREGSGKFRARLWQDPFLAVVDARGKNKWLKLDIKKFEQYLTDKKSESRSITVLSVMVSSGPYPDNSEMRLRSRYAVVSGLSRLGFVPEDSQHIEAFSYGYGRDFDQNRSEDAPVSMRNLVPYEYFKRKGNDGNKQNREERDERVLLLWLSEEALQGKPLQLLDALYREHILPYCQNSCKLSLIGPYGSETLSDMLKELKYGNFCFSNLKEKFEIYSATATAPPPFLLNRAGYSELENGPEESARKSIIKKFHDKNIVFIPCINSDAEFAGKIIKELELRHIHIDPSGKKHDNVVLISEWDSFYGRTLPFVFIKAIIEKNDKNFRFTTCDNANKKVPWVRRFSYLRGLDGKLPGDSEQKTEYWEQKDANSKEVKEEIHRMEDPTGKAQYDYLRRLADSIYKDEQDLNKQGDAAGSIKAIGVLGSDFYDKSLVLQALQQRFPQVVFFTTDMDARMLDPVKFESMRNLIVASSYSLELDRKLQGDIPPFRDSYQTSMFLSVLRALSSDIPPDFKPEPRIFEIGRNGPVRLKQKDERPSELEPGMDAESGWAFSPGDIKNMVIALLVVLPVLLYLSISSMKRIISKHLLKIIIFLVLSLVIGLGIGYISNQPGEEPFSFFGGISSWPAEIIRIITLAISCLFIWILDKRLHENNAEIDGKAERSSFADHKAGAENGLWYKRFYNIIKYDWDMNDILSRINNKTEKQKGEDDITVNDIWEEYIYRDNKRMRRYRVSLIVLVYTFFCSLVFKVFEPPLPPIRGDFSYYSYFVIIGSVGFSFTWLTFRVVDATRLCCRFIELVSGQSPKWREYLGRERSLKNTVKNISPENREILSELYLIRLIGDRTEAVGKFIFYPVAVWVLLFLSRIRYFDNWYLWIGLAIVLTVSALYAWSCGFWLRHSSEMARENALWRLLKKKEVLFLSNEPNADRIQLIEHVMKEIREIKTGTFIPFMQHPLVQSLLMSFGGIGGAAFLNYLTILNF